MRTALKPSFFLREKSNELFFEINAYTICIILSNLGDRNANEAARND
jgi:hypothetical protein